MAVLGELERMNGFTETERALARFILERPDEVAQMSISALAEQTYSSNASIVRLCRKLGVDGYRDFRIQLAGDLERRRARGDDADVDRPFQKDESSGAVISGLAVLLKRAIDDCYAETSAGRVEQAARIIQRSRCLFLFATGDSQISAEAFANMLLKIGVQAIVANRYGEVPATALTAMPGDAALFVSYSGNIMNQIAMKRVARLLKERGCRIIWISAAEMPVGFDIHLRLPAREDNYSKIATFYSQACIRYVFDCLYSVIYSLDYEGGDGKKSATDDVIMSIALLEGLHEA